MTTSSMIVLIILFELLICLIYVYTMESDCALEYYGFVTKYLYERSNMNILGCVLVALVYYVFIPALFIPRSVGMFVYWLCHIGRKD